MSKELINEIESKIAWNDMSIDETSISLKDVKRLLNELEEQAERVQELENHLKLYDSWHRTAYEQNKRYREALEEIANSDGWLIEPNPLCTVDEAYGRCVEKARQVLEGENNE